MRMPHIVPVTFHNGGVRRQAKRRNAPVPGLRLSRERAAQARIGPSQSWAPKFYEVYSGLTYSPY